jgi:protocatechuate 3,4-dioxygenase beta subunit
MNRLPRYAIILALSLGYAGLGVAAHAQTKAMAKVPASTVSGRITVHGKGTAGIAVGIRSAEFSPQPRPSLKGTSDQDGYYRIVDVPPGNYVVTPLAPAYVSLDQSSARGRGKLLLLAAGENVEGIDFSLERGGVITGKVTDSDGRAVVEMRLTIVPADQTNQPGQRTAPPAVPNSFQTDDRGVYRIYGIPEGRYKIFAGEADENPNPTSGPGRVPYKRTFHPDATDPKDAGIVEVSEGSETIDIDIRLGQSLPRFAVSGRVVDGETGKPLPGLRVGLRRVRNDGFANMNFPVASNSQGEFRLENATPGKYAVQVLAMPGSEVRADPVTLEVVDQDVTGIVVKTSAGLSVSGTVVVDGKSDPSILAKLSQLRLRVYVYSDRTVSGGYGQSLPLGADGSFRMGGLGPGSANFSLASLDNAPLTDFAILRVERDGVVLPRGVEIKAGEQVTGVKIVLRYGTGSIRGEVKLENGPLPEGARISVWIRKPGETAANPRSNARQSNVDSRGHFLIEGVSAGDYELNVNANIPGTRKPPPHVKQAVTVTEGAVSNVVVTLDLAPEPSAPAP